MPYTYSGMTGGGNYGDYYRGDYYVGDPFLGGLFKKIGGVVKGAVGGFLSGGPVGALTGAASGLIGSGGRARLEQVTQGTALAPFERLRPPSPGQIKIREQYGPDIAQEIERQRAFRAGKRRRGMNPMNPKALRRASRRMDRFTKDVRRALKHTPYTLTRRGVSGGRRGSPGYITKSEASRALRR